MLLNYRAKTKRYQLIDCTDFGMIKGSLVKIALLIAGTSLSLLPGSANAAGLITGLGGPLGFGTDSVFRNDDSGVGPVPLPFPINFYGGNYNNYFVNTNGNITFQSVLGAFTPSFFPGAPQPIIAPWWADVDTRNPSTGDNGLVWYVNPDANTTVVTWNNVGVFSQLNPPSNNFQLILRNLAPTTGTTGDFSIEFRYDDLNWTTGQASGGDSNGLGGTPAVAGFDSGNGMDYLVLPGSGTSGPTGVLNLVNTSNANEPGAWRFNVINGRPSTGSVPGPLPVLGIGAAFGYSRKLRNRIKNVKTPKVLSAIG